MPSPSPAAARAASPRALAYKLLLVVLLGSWCLLGVGCGHPRALAPPSSSACSPALRHYTVADLSSWEQHLTWRSQEDGLRLLLDICEHAGSGDLVVDDAVLTQLGRLHSTLPLSACRSLHLHQGVMQIELDGPQHISVPHTLHQASITLDPQLEVAMATSRGPTRTLTLVLRQGSIALEFSWLARSSVRWAIDVPIDRLQFEVTDASSSCYVRITHTDRIPSSAMSWTRDGSELAIALHGTGFAPDARIQISPNLIAVTYWRDCVWSILVPTCAQLAEDAAIPAAQRERALASPSWRWHRHEIDAALINPSRLLDAGVELLTVFGLDPDDHPNTRPIHYHECHFPAIGEESANTPGSGDPPLGPLLVPHA